MLLNNTVEHVLKVKQKLTSTRKLIKRKYKDIPCLIVRVREPGNYFARIKSA